MAFFFFFVLNLKIKKQSLLFKGFWPPFRLKVSYLLILRVQLVIIIAFILLKTKQFHTKKNVSSEIVSDALDLLMKLIGLRYSEVEVNIACKYIMWSIANKFIHKSYCK